MKRYELYIPPLLDGRNKVTGEYLPGHVPYNKGMTWDEYLSKDAQERCKKGWDNFQKYRPKHRPDNCGRCRKPVIAVMDNGCWLYFSYLGAAAEWIGGSRENIGRCCRYNRQTALRWGKHPPNTDHRYLGVRWYFEEDNIWISKIKQQ